MLGKSREHGGGSSPGPGAAPHRSQEGIPVATEQVTPAEPRTRPREDWSDEEFITYWIERQEERHAERDRQFAMIRAIVPYATDEAFRYLNVGSGPGALDAVLLERFTQAQAVLSDNAEGMLKHAHKVLAAYGSRASFVRSDFSSPDWVQTVQGPFDLVVSSIAIHNLRDPRRIRALYAEIFGLLGDGGMFMNMDYIRAASASLGPLAERAVKDPDAGFLVGRGGKNMPGTSDEQLSWLREAGFQPVECFWKELRISLFGGFKNGVPASLKA